MIIGLTDGLPAFPTIGTLRKGAPKGQGSNKPGGDLTYFRFDSDDEAALRRFNEIYGPEPRAIRAFLPYSTTLTNFEAWREEWTASSLRHRCDGKTCVRWLNPMTGKYSDEPKPCPGGCKQVGRLQIFVPELRRAALVVVQTTSIHDIKEIYQNLSALEALRGDLRGIPIIVKRAPREISTPSGQGGQRVRREKWLITIEAAPNWVELQLQAQERAAMPEASPLALPAWDEEEDEEEDAKASSPQSSKREELIERIRAVFGAQRRLDKWPEYQKKSIEGKDIAALEELLGRLEKAAATKLLEEIEGPLTIALKGAGASAKEILDKIAQIASGEVGLETMDYSTLVNVRDGLEAWSRELAAKVAPKVEATHGA